METVTVILFVLVTIFGTTAVVATVFAMLAYYKHDDQETLTHASAHGHDPKEIVHISKGTYTATLPRKDVTGTSFTTTPGITVGSLTTPVTTTGHVLNLTNPPNITITTTGTPNPNSYSGGIIVPAFQQNGQTFDGSPPMIEMKLHITMGNQTQSLSTVCQQPFGQPTWTIALPTTWLTEKVGLDAGSKTISVAYQSAINNSWIPLTLATDAVFNVSSSCATQPVTLVEVNKSTCSTA